MDLSTLPKVELHLHLDCSLSYEVVRAIDPKITFEEYRATFVGPPRCHDLADFLTRAVNGIRLMQTREQLEMVTKDLFKQLQADQVIYAEIRFAPLLHTEKGLSAEEVVKVVDHTVVQSIKETGIEARLILCTLRHFSEAQSMETVRLVEQFKGSKVVGFDIAGDEAGFPITNHVKAFQYAKENSIPCTAHAGEAKGPASVWETLNRFGPSRIGHGIRSIEDAELMAFLKQKNIHLEVCPTSNLQTNIYSTIKQHPADEIYQSGISMSINTDTRTISDTNLPREYQLLEQTFGWKKNHFLKCNLEAIEHAFLPLAQKLTLKRKVEIEYAKY